MSEPWQGLDDLTVRVHLDQRRAVYELRHSLAFQSEVVGRSILVPSGFRTDFGSVPRVLEWAVSGEDTQLLPGAIVHDYLYRLGGKLPDGGVIGRLTADRIFMEAMQSRGASFGKRNAVWTAIRVGGRYP